MFVDESGRAIDFTKNEISEQALASILILPGSRVLELGSRYGTVTCKISEKTGSIGVTVAVEPDASIWDALDKNLATNKCDVKVIRGLLSAKPMTDSAHSIPAAEATSASSEESLRSPMTFSLQDALTLGGVPIFDTLVADCERFLESFLIEDDTFLNGLHTIMFKADRKGTCDYKKIREKLERAGFNPILEGFENAWIKNRSLEKRDLRAIKKLGGLRSGDIYVICASILLIGILFLGIFWAMRL